MLLGVLAACSDNGEDVVDMLPELRPITLTAEQQQMRDNNNEFACRLFRTVNEQKEGNGSLIVSPISVTYMLGMLNTGADGQTRQQIADVLGLGGSVTEINEYCKKMIDEAPRVDPSVTVQIANCIDVNSALGITLVPQFKTDMQNYYNAQIEALDFTKSSSLDKINSWCKKNTDGMIPSILDRLSPNAAMCLLNAIYFKATWTEKFDPKDTRDMDFTMPDGSTSQHKMMHRKALAAYDKNDLCEMLYLPYGSNGYGMYVLLPVEGKTVDDVIQGLSADAVKQQLFNMDDHVVDILMPRFTTSSETMLDKVLPAMGMIRAFNPYYAEFPNMAQGQQSADDPNMEHNRNLYVSMMKQKAKIEVNEEGTKASAVTIAEMGFTAAPPPPQYQQVDFHATRPFVYYIVETSTRSIFFMGTYCGE
jgi:serpin B